ncbi:unnamed protein product (macronuclear) [Paramecium tetraurelia]|uniref:ENTH domain-containing protein n=1 Tax=Paramecium tetraurelia TaxID=5888 RepID=A0DFH7_PARTE|nr:uncharacterized protein GSPATT00016607001 [Paramecium tetraurelia]CAK81794.1 unnamed protein product [Paramecium tetraurelia]|eukprot:XP_001449191.1 hypothetical protein (macronuclear) [Paramecium tetraurelia strain d4-2]
MSSILNKFRKQPQNDVPAGIKIENTLFGQPQGTYQPPIIPSVQLSQTNQPRQKGRPGGGWDDEPEPQQQQQQTSSNMPANTINLINDTPPKQNENKANFGILLPPQPSNNDIQLSRVSEYKKGQLLTYEELEIGGFEFEFHIVEEAIKLGGIKLKQSDSVLKEFARACQTLQEQLIGSILLNKLYSEENWKVQIRCIYAIQFISQQYQNYREFFLINQNYLKIDTDQQILKSAIEQTLLEINGQQTQKQKEIQFEFREPPKPQQNAVQQQANLFEIGNNEGQQKQQQQQKLDLKSLKIKQPEVKQQTQQNTQIDLLEAFNQMSVQNPSQNQQQQQNQGINFDEILNTQTTQTVQQPQQKKNAFGFLKKDQQQQPQQQPPQQLKQDQAQLNTLLLQPPQQLYQQPAPNQQQASNIPSGQPSNLYNLQQQAQFGQPNYSQAFAQFNIQQQQYNLVQQTQFSQEQPQQKQQPAPKENAFDFLNF